MKATKNKLLEFNNAFPNYPNKNLQNEVRKIKSEISNIMKNIKDYLHFYLGSEVMHTDPFTKGKTIVILKGVDWYLDIITYEVYLQCKIGIRICDTKLILRPLSDMTDDECNEYNKIQLTTFSVINPFADQCKQEAAKTKFLLSKGFDLFGLIDEGLAIDKKTLDEKK